jgi:DNA-binding transcriptional MerR regulator
VGGVNGDEVYSIGELARRTGLTVKAIRFYSDRGLVPPTNRSPAGYRRYNLAAIARLELVRTLRELGLDLATIRSILDRETALSDVAAAHAEALAVQIRTLRLRRAILTAVADRGSTPEELELMHKLAKLSEHERLRLVEDFLDTVFGDAPEFVAVRRSMTPELPDNPEPEQVEAWVELAELSQDPDFRSTVRRMAEDYLTTTMRPGLVATISGHVRPALAAGIAPDSPEARPITATIIALYARATTDTVPRDGLTERLSALLETANDPRWARYLELLAAINGWEAPDSLRPIYDWTIGALRHAG